MPGCQAVGLLVPKLLVPQLPGYRVVVAEAGHNCGWLNVWLVELWQQVRLHIGRDYSVRSSRIARLATVRSGPKISGLDSG